MSRRPRTVGYRWHLRRLMAEHGMFATTDLVPLLAERGIALSSVQVYRLVAQTPERLNLRTLVALCDILGCTPADLVEPVIEAKVAKRAAGGSTPTAPAAGAKRPRRARIVPDES